MSRGKWRVRGLPQPASRADGGELVVLQCSSKLGHGKRGLGTSSAFARRAGRWPNGRTGRLTQARDRGSAPRSNPGTCGSDLPWPKPTCQRRAMNDSPEMPFLGAAGEIGEARKSGELSREAKARQDEFFRPRVSCVRNAACPSAKKPEASARASASHDSSIRALRSVRPR